LLVDFYLKLKLYTPLFVVEFPLQTLKNFSKFSASCPGKGYPSVSSSPAVSIINGDVHVFGQEILHLITIYINSLNILFAKVTYRG